jgi:hypothetical protein
MAARAGSLCRARFHHHLGVGVPLSSLPRQRFRAGMPRKVDRGHVAAKMAIHCQDGHGFERGHLRNSGLGWPSWAPGCIVEPFTDGVSRFNNPQSASRVLASIGNPQSLPPSP